MWRHVPRALLVLLAALAAGDLRVRDPEPPRLRIFVLDRSKSFEPARARIEATLALGARDLDLARDRVAVIGFAKAPFVALEPSPVSELPHGARRALATPVDPRGSDLGAALDLARDMARATPAASEAVLLTDGRDTAGRAREAAARLAASGVAVHAVAPLVPPLPNARVASVRAPSRVGVGEPARIEVEIQSSMAGRVATAIECDAAVIGPSRIDDVAEPDVPLRRTFVVRPGREGLVRGNVRVDLPGDAFSEDDVAEFAFLAGKRSRALVVAPNGAWEALLDGAGFAVEHVAAERVGDALRAGPQADLVVLDEVPASEAPVAALLEFLGAGGGLVVAGDLNAFGLGGYADSELEQLLPVRSGPPDSRAKPLALEIVIDKSGSMDTKLRDGRSRYETAVDSVVPRTQELGKGDRLEVITFDDTHLVHTESDDRKLLQELREVRVGGGTDIGAALEAALDRLAGSDGRRVLVLVTDGEDLKALGHAAAIKEKADKLGADFEAALIGLGGEGAATLKGLADSLGPRARFYPVEEAGDKLAKLVRGDIVQGAKHARRVGSFVTDIGVTVGSYAPLRPREGAHTEVFLRDPERELRASLAVSGGRVLCVATDLATGGAALGPRLLDAVRRVARPPSELEVHAERTPGWISLSARSSLSGLHVELNGERAPLLPVAPGELEARLRSTDAALVRILRGSEVLGAAFVPPESSLELAPPRRDLELLEAIAPGVLPELGALPRPQAPPNAQRALAKDLALAALAFLVFEGVLAVLLERLAARRAAARTFNS